ncbi:maestro heat-like repeat-containing protein family member 1 [Prorops nasuta]|uniref:maestro heat-like repeat-containing protein family member 1 n=1 Tax=Prorops nasuta TaxID=863751 RepID=UPI0034CE22AA
MTEGAKSENSELPAIISVLFDVLDDKEVDVRKTAIESIQRISNQYPKTVIHTGIYFMELHKKVSSEHMNLLLSVITYTCKNGIHLEANVASSVAELAVRYLNGDTELEASLLLLALSKKHCMQSMGELLSKLDPGVLPQSIIVNTIGKIAVANPLGMLSFYKIILTIIIPMLSVTRDDNLKISFCITLGKFAESINDLIINSDSLHELTRETFKEEFSLAFEILMYEWSRLSKDYKLIDAILVAATPMISLLPKETHNGHLPKLVPMFLNFCKKPRHRSSATKALASTLNNTQVEGKEALRPFLDSLFLGLFDLINISPFEAPRDVQLVHYEALQCSRILVLLFPEEALDRILTYLKSTVSLHQARALVVLRHLINTLPSEDDESLQRIALNLQESLGESCARQMVGALAALAARPTIPLLPSQRTAFVRYMVAHCESKHDESDTYTDALYLLATTVNAVESWLWPCLINSLLDKSYTPSAIPIFKALTPMAVKIIDDNNSTKIVKNFSGMKVLTRCFELSQDWRNHVAVASFLKSAASLFGNQISNHWNDVFLEIVEFIQNDSNNNNSEAVIKQNQFWENSLVVLLEKSAELEGEDWAQKLSNEFAIDTTVPIIAPLLASITNNDLHINLLVLELSRLASEQEVFARAVGICSKRHLTKVLGLLEQNCQMEDSRKIPVRLLGLVKDTKVAANVENAKTSILRCYMEIAKRADSQQLYPAIEKHILPWITRQIINSKELKTKQAGILALEQVARALHPESLPDFKGLNAKDSSLATLLILLQSSTGYKPVQLYLPVLKAIMSLVRLPPVLKAEQRQVLLSTAMDKILAASSEITFQQQPEILQETIHELSAVCSEIVGDHSDALTEFIDILLSWLQSKSNIERKATLSVFRVVLRSYYSSLKYTYPGGKFEPGKILGRLLSCCVDPDPALRPLVVDCVALLLHIAMRHCSTRMDNDVDEKINNIKQIMVNEDFNMIYKGIKDLTSIVSERLPTGNVISLAEGLTEALLFHGESGMAAGIALSQHFFIKGSDFSKSDMFIVDYIMKQMRQIANSSCRQEAAVALIALMKHHPEMVVEHLLYQPLPFDRSCEECWREIGHCPKLASTVLKVLLVNLENNNLLAESSPSSQMERKNTASVGSLAAMMAMKNLLTVPRPDTFIEKHIVWLLSVLLKYLAGWLNVEVPASVASTRYGYVPNKEICKINPQKEVYTVIINTLVGINADSKINLLEQILLSSEESAENVVQTVHIIIESILNRNDILSSLAKSLEKLLESSGVIAQRAVAVAFYAEIIGKVSCGDAWLHAIINMLIECKSDSSALVRKLATIGLSRIAYLEPQQMDKYFDKSMSALLEGLEEPMGEEGGIAVILESLKGLSLLLSVPIQRMISPQIVLALKPFIEKENLQIREAALNVLHVVIRYWKKYPSLKDNDINDYLLGCIPCLIIRVVDSNLEISMITKKILYDSAELLHCIELAKVISSHLKLEVFNHESFLNDLIQCLLNKLPERADELRNAVTRGYSRSENSCTRSTSAIILGLFGKPTEDTIQRLLQLIRDNESNVRIESAKALSLCFV